MQKVIECFDGALELVAIHRQRGVEEQDDVAWPGFGSVVAALIEERRVNVLTDVSAELATLRAIFVRSLRAHFAYKSMLVFSLILVVARRLKRFIKHLRLLVE